MRETEQKPTDRKSHYADKKTCIREDTSEEKNKPTKTTNRKGKRNHRRRRTRPKTKTHRMGRYRTNGIQSTNRKWDADLRTVNITWAQEKQHSTKETDNALKTTWGEIHKKHAHAAAGPIAQLTNYPCASNYYR